MDLTNKIQIVGITDTGLVRQKNEDSINFDEQSGLIILADGMGGHRGGEVASSMAVETISQHVLDKFPSIKRGQIHPNSGFSFESICLQDSIELANDKIYQTAENSPEHKGMGTTIVVLQFYDNKLSLAHIGDSRCYRIRGKNIEQLTKDHSLLQELIDRGFYTKEEAKYSMNKNLVTRALGIDPVVSADIQEDIVMKGDVYLLCSDGLTDLVDDEQIHLTINKFSANLEEAAKQLITKANQNGGKDNISVMISQINENFSDSRNWFKQMMTWFD